MRQILPSGCYFEVDAAGCIVNPCSAALVPESLWSLVNAVVQIYQDQHGEELLAVYLRGSVPRGMAMSPVSDLDVVGIVRHHAHDKFQRWATPAWAQAVQAQIQAGFSDPPSIDWAIADHDPAFPGENRSVKFVLKTQALCVWGADITETWPAFKLDSSLAFNHRWLAQDWEIWKTDWRDQDDSAAKTAFIQSFAKTVLRAGFELVMEREGRYTVDLYPCYQAFSRHYPEQAADMESALLSYLNPSQPDHIHNAWMESLLPMLIAEASKRLA